MPAVSLWLFKTPCDCCGGVVVGGDNGGGERDGLQALTGEMCTNSQVNLY